MFFFSNRSSDSLGLRARSESAKFILVVVARKLLNEMRRTKKVRANGMGVNLGQILGKHEGDATAHARLTRRGFRGAGGDGLGVHRGGWWWYVASERIMQRVLSSCNQMLTFAFTIAEVDHALIRSENLVTYVAILARAKSRTVPVLQTHTIWPYLPMPVKNDMPYGVPF